MTTTTVDASALSPAAHVRTLARTMFRRGPAQRTLHLTWFAFFCTFVVWFGFAPFATTIGRQFDLTKGQLVTLGLCNLALTIPARLVVGTLLDRFGPRRTFTGILVYSAGASLLFATAQTFEMLVVSRLAVSVVGAGFVVGIRMVAEWFPRSELGTAEGIYGGWGNFGAAAATLGLPPLAALIGGPDAWRWATGGVGVAAALYGLAYYRAVDDTPAGVPFERTRSATALQVPDRRSVFGLMALSVPLAMALGVIVWRIRVAGVIDQAGLLAGLAFVAVLLGLQCTAIWRTNGAARANAVPAAEQYPFRSVVVLSVAYACTFGSELAAVSFLPEYFERTWGLSEMAAGAAAAGFAVLNLVSRPMGGMLSDVVASRRRWLSTLLAGLSLGFVALSTVSGDWPVAAAFGLVVVTSLFAQLGNGAVYAIVPLVNKRASGQIAGMVGAYGNAGGIAFLATLLFASTGVGFLVMAGAAALAMVAGRWLVEPARGPAGVVAPAGDPTEPVAIAGGPAEGGTVPAWAG